VALVDQGCAKIFMSEFDRELAWPAVRGLRAEY
jgi:hypothetical protein